MWKINDHVMMCLMNLGKNFLFNVTCRPDGGKGSDELQTSLINFRISYKF